MNIEDMLTTHLIRPKRQRPTSSTVRIPARSETLRAAVLDG